MVAVHPVLVPVVDRAAQGEHLRGVQEREAAVKPVVLAAVLAVLAAVLAARQRRRRQETISWAWQQRRATWPG